MKILTFLFALFAFFSPSLSMAADENIPPFTISDDVSDEQLSLINQKASTYVEVLNEFGTAEFVEAVAERIKMQDARKPSDKNWSVRISTLGYSPKFTAALNDNTKLTPRMEPGDTAMEQIAQSYPKLLKNMEALDQYYERGDHRDDGGKKGQEIGAALKADFKLFMDAHNVLQASFDQIDGALKNATLSRFEKAYGKKFFWHHSMLIRKAEAMLTMVPEDMKAFDVNAFEAAFRDFKSTVDAYEEYIKTAGPNLRKEARGEVNPKWISGFISSCRDIMDYKKKNLPIGYAGEAETLVAFYNNMVKNSNEIQFSMPPQ